MSISKQLALRSRLVDRFLRYVKVASPSGQEQKFAGLIKKELSGMGIKWRQDKIGNILARIPGTDTKTPTILLNAHLDTVKHTGPIKSKISKGVIRSDGKTILGADNKAGMAVIMEVLDDLPEKHAGLIIVFTVQEEIGLLGAKSLEKIDADFGFALDGGSVDIIHQAAPAQINIRAEVMGKAAHAGTHPEDGINAIQVASRAIAGMKLGRIDHETTANIGLIEGGEATNIVPERALVKGEARSLNAAKLKKQIDHMVKSFTTACHKQGARIKLEVKKAYPSFRIPDNDPVVRRVKNAILQVGIAPKLKPTGGGSDANIFNSRGIKTLILGVGAHNFHSPKEYLEVAGMLKGYELIKQVITNA